MTSSILTEYYRTMPKLEPLGCNEEAKFKFRNYDIFMIETRVYPYIYELIGKDVEIIFRGIHQKDKMMIYMEFKSIVNTADPYIMNPPLLLSNDIIQKIKNKINKVTSEYIDSCLIDINQLYMSGSKKYSFSWMQSVLPYVPLTSEYNPFIRPEGIYLEFNPLSDYITAYREVTIHISKTLEDYYNKGIVYGGQKIADDWKLVRVDTEEALPGLYQPVWVDNRFAKDIVNFLLLKISGDPYVRYPLPDNLVNRHFIIKTLQNNDIDSIIEGSMLKVSSNTLSKAQKIASLITYGLSLSSGKVLILSVDRMSWIHLFKQISNELKLYDHVVYEQSSIEDKYIFSCIIPETYSVEALMDVFRTKSLTRLIDLSKIKKTRNISPHDLIEKEFSK